MVVDSTTPKPVPNIAVPAHSYELSLSERVPDEFDLRSHGRVKAARVRGWRTTLRRGFHATFGKVDTRESDGQLWQLRMTHSHLTFETRRRDAAVTLVASNGEGTLIAHGVHLGPKPPTAPNPVVARINFACELLSPDGELVALSRPLSTRRSRSRGRSIKRGTGGCRSDVRGDGEATILTARGIQRMTGYRELLKS